MVVVRGGMVEIRTATETDRAQIADLLTQLGYPGTDGFIREKIEQLASHPDGEVAVAVENDAVVGFISLHFIPQLALHGDFARISYLCVDEAARSNGVGQQLLAYAELRARQRGCDRLELHCHSRRERAHAFYYRHGYAESPKYLLKMLK
jgi:GNAT superfamily N-acetyltransferase